MFVNFQYDGPGAWLREVEEAHAPPAVDMSQGVNRLGVGSWSCSWLREVCMDTLVSLLLGGESDLQARRSKTFLISQRE